MTVRSSVGRFPERLPFSRWERGDVPIAACPPEATPAGRQYRQVVVPSGSSFLLAGTSNMLGRRHDHARGCHLHRCSPFTVSESANDGMERARTVPDIDRVIRHVRRHLQHGCAKVLPDERHSGDRSHSSGHWVTFGA